MATGSIQRSLERCRKDQEIDSVQRIILTTRKSNTRRWKVWADSPAASPVLELEIKCPAGVWQRSDRRGYMFRLALEWTTNEADRANTAFNNELMEKDGIVLANKNTKLLNLDVPD